MQEFQDFIVFPPTILIDNQEKLPLSFTTIEPDLSKDLELAPCRKPYDFLGLHGDARDENKPLIIRSRLANLPWGDYSLEGLQHKVAVERKSGPDLFSSLTHERERFEREVAALDRFDVAVIVIEQTWGDMLRHPPTRANPKSMYRTCIAWSQRYPRVHWRDCQDRRLAEITTFRILERYWRDRCANSAIAHRLSRS